MKHPKKPKTRVCRICKGECDEHLIATLRARVYRLETERAELWGDIRHNINQQQRFAQRGIRQ